MRTFILDAIALSVGLSFATTTLSQDLSKIDYSQARNRIASELSVARTACAPMSGNAKDICLAQAKGVGHVALADLENQYKPTTKTRYNARVARAESDYAVAKERCDDMAGNGRDVCFKEAKAIEVSAIADARTQMTTSDAMKAANELGSTARKDGAAERNDAQFQVAKEKCDRLDGSAKEGCLTGVRARFGK